MKTGKERPRGGGSECLLQDAVLSTIIESSPDGVLVVDTNWKMAYFNNKFVELWGIEPHILEAQDDRKSLQSVLGKIKEPEKFLKKVEYLQHNPTDISLDEIHLKDGRIFERHSVPARTQDGEYYGRIWYFRDITGIKSKIGPKQTTVKGEEGSHLRNITGALVHHVNNLLTGISGYTQLARHRLEEDLTSEALRYLDKTERVTEQAIDFTRKILIASQGIMALRTRITRLDTLITNVAKAVQLESEKMPDLIFKGDVVECHIDPDLLADAVRHLLLNAKEALAGRLEGRIWISWGWQDANIAHVNPKNRQAPKVQPGNWIFIRVSDNGQGMEVDTMDKAFAPFFTTKEFGRGLGLSLALGAVRSHGGHMEISSNLSRGTEVTLSIPCKGQEPVKRD